jgi:phage tail-like protein
MDRWKIVALSLAALFATAMIGGQKHASDQVSKAYGFRVEISGLAPMPVRVVEGIALNVAVVEVEAPGEAIVRKIPGRLKWENITLKRGVVADSPFFRWLQSAAQGDDSELFKDVSITLLDRAGNDLHTVEYVECFLSGYELVPFSTPGAGEGLEEAVTFSCDRVDTGRSG